MVSNLAKQYIFLILFAITFYYVLNYSIDTSQPESSTTNTQKVEAQQPTLQPQKEFTTQEITAAFQQKTTVSLARLKAHFATTEQTDSFTVIDNASIDVKKTDSLLTPYQGVMQVKTYMVNTTDKLKTELNYKIGYSWRNNAWAVDDYTYHIPLFHKTYSSTETPKTVQLLEALKKP
ncbi:MAG: hypothetical protein PHV05_00925 [Candidatus Riflebacteria bacterium]|nr:hypothetical protein [Candidatus Riflebacteria bacterium]